MRVRAARSQIRRERHEGSGKAVSWIAAGFGSVLAIVGTVLGFLARSRGHEALRALRQLGPDAAVPHPETGKPVSVTAFLAEVEPRILAVEIVYFSVMFIGFSIAATTCVDASARARVHRRVSA